MIRTQRGDCNLESMRAKLNLTSISEEGRFANGRAPFLLATRPMCVEAVNLFAASRADIALLFAAIKRHIHRKECREYGAIHSSA